MDKYFVYFNIGTTCRPTMNIYRIIILSVYFIKLFAVTTIVVFYRVATANKLQSKAKKKYIKDAGQGRWSVALIFLINLFCSCIAPSFRRSSVNRKKKKKRKISAVFSLWIPVLFFFYSSCCASVVLGRHLDAERG